MVGDVPKTISGTGKYQYHKLCSCLSYLFASTYALLILAKKKNIQHYLKFLQKYTRNDNPVSLEKTISNIKQELETVWFDDRTTTFEIDWANECENIFGELIKLYIV